MVTMFFRSPAITAAVALAAVTSTLAATSDPSDCEDDSMMEYTLYEDDGCDSAFNEALTKYLYDPLFSRGNLPVTVAFIRSTDIQNNPNVAGGPQALRQGITIEQADFLRGHNFIGRVLADGDLALIHSDACAPP